MIKLNTNKSNEQVNLENGETLKKFEITHILKGEIQKFTCDTTSFNQVKAAAEACSLNWLYITNKDNGEVRSKKTL